MEYENKDSHDTKIEINAHKWKTCTKLKAIIIKSMSYGINALKLTQSSQNAKLMI